MKPLHLCVMLALLSIPVELCAQCTDMTETKADRVFNLSKYFTRHRHIAYLENENKMTIELFYLEDYSTIKNIDSLVKTVMQEIAFYKDSLEDLGPDNVKIDFVQTRDNKFKKTRFTRHRSIGNSFVSINGNVSGLKLNQDTIRIKIVNEETNFYGCPNYMERKENAEKARPVQITFVLNNYNDINELAKNGELTRIADTFVKRVGAEKDLKNPYRVSTIFYHPYEKDNKLVLQKDHLLDDLGKEGNKKTLGKSEIITGIFGVGAGLVRNRLAPSISFGLAYSKRHVGLHDNYKIFSLYASPYYFFNKQADGQYRTYISWFLNAEYGNTYSSKSESKFGEMGFGLGYLINPDNSVFQKNTVKAFYNFTFHNGLTISPGVIATNNFRNFLPSITFRFFGIR